MLKGGSNKFPELQTRFQFAIPFCQDMDSTAHNSVDRTSYDFRPHWFDTFPRGTNSDGTITTLLGIGRHFRWLGSFYMSYSQYIDSNSAPKNRLEGGMRGTFGRHKDDDMSEAEFDAKYVGKYFGNHVDFVAVEGGKDNINNETSEVINNSGLDQHPDLAEPPRADISDYPTFKNPYKIGGNNYGVVTPAFTSANIVGNANAWFYGKKWGDAPHGNYERVYQLGISDSGVTLPLGMRQPRSRVKLIDWPGSRNENTGAGFVLPVVSIVDDIVTLDRPLSELGLTPEFKVSGGSADYVELSIVSGNTDLQSGRYEVSTDPNQKWEDMPNQPISKEQTTGCAEFRDIENEDGEMIKTCVTDERVPIDAQTNFFFSQPDGHGVPNRDDVRVLRNGEVITDKTYAKWQSIDPYAIYGFHHKPPHDLNAIPLSELTLQREKRSAQINTFRLHNAGTANDVSNIVLKVIPNQNALATKNKQWKAGERDHQACFTDHALATLSAAGGRSCGFAKKANLHVIYGGVEAIESLIEWHKNKPINPETGEKNPTISICEWGYTNDGKRNFFPLDSIAKFQHKGSMITKPSGGWGTNLRVFTDANLIPWRIEDPDNPGTWLWTIPMGKGREYTRLKDTLEEAWDAGIIVMNCAGNWGNVAVKRDDPEYLGTKLHITAGANYYFAANGKEMDPPDYSSSLSGKIAEMQTKQAEDEGLGYQTFNPFITSGPSFCSRDKGIDVAAGHNSETYPTLDGYSTRGPGIDIVGAGRTSFVSNSYGTEFPTDTWTGSGNYLDPILYLVQSYAIDNRLTDRYPFKSGETVRIDDLGETNSAGHDVQTQWHTYLGTTAQTDWNDLVPGYSYIITNLGTGTQHANMMADRQQEWNDLLGTSGVTYAVGNTITIPDNPGGNGTGGVGGSADYVFSVGDNFVIPNPNVNMPLNSQASPKGWSYGNYSGTSAAGPSVSGKVACIIEKQRYQNGYWPSPIEAKRALLDQAKDVIVGYDSVNWSNTPPAGPYIIDHPGSMNTEFNNLVTNPRFISDYDPTGHSPWKNANNKRSLSSAGWSSEGGVISPEYSFEIAKSTVTLGTARNQVLQLGIKDQGTENSNDDQYYTSLMWSNNVNKLTHGYRSSVTSAVPETLVQAFNGEAGGIGISYFKTEVGAELRSTSFFTQGDAVGSQLFLGSSNWGFNVVGWNWYDANGSSIGNAGFGSIASDVFLDGTGKQRTIRDMWWARGTGLGTMKSSILCFSIDGRFVPNTNDTFGSIDINGQRYFREDANYSHDQNGNTTWWWNIGYSEYTALGNTGTVDWKVRGTGKPKAVLRITNSSNSAAGASTSFNVSNGIQYTFVVDNPSAPIKLQLGSTAGASNYFDETSDRKAWRSTVSGTVHLTIRPVSTTQGDSVDIGFVSARGVTYNELVTSAPYVNSSDNSNYGTNDALHRNYVTRRNGGQRFLELAGTTTKRAFFDEGGEFEYSKFNTVPEPDSSTAIFPLPFSVATNESRFVDPQRRIIYDDFTTFPQENDPDDEEEL